MLRPEALLSYVRADHFRPFRIKMLSGKTYDIRHPEMIRVMRDYFVETVSLVHVDNITHIDQTAAQAS
jgi:hypothetical protein